MQNEFASMRTHVSGAVTSLKNALFRLASQTVRHHRRAWQQPASYLSIAGTARCSLTNRLSDTLQDEADRMRIALQRVQAEATGFASHEVREGSGRPQEALILTPADPLSQVTEMPERVITR
jgi:hypothetical protein